MLKIAHSIWKVIVSIFTFFLDAARDFFEWMKQPGSKLKFICGIFAMLFMTFGLIAFVKEQEVQRLNTLIVSNEVECKLIIAKRDENILSKDAALAEIAKKLKAEEEKLEALRAASAAEIGILQSQLEKQQMDEQTWKERYNKRPNECRAALELLDSACPAMGDY